MDAAYRQALRGSAPSLLLQLFGRPHAGTSALAADDASLNGGDCIITVNGY